MAILAGLSSPVVQSSDYRHPKKVLDAYYPAEDENSDTSKLHAAVSANLVEICESLGNFDLCALHLKRTMVIVNITLMD